jgi:arginase
VSRLRARCPRCRTLTAVPVGEGYECHACGAVYPAGLVRVPRAWGSGGEAMAQAAALPLPYPDVATVEEDGLAEQNLALAASLPARPLVLGGCCCAHVGAVEGLAARYDRVAVVWIDAHGDLNTPETSPSGNAWGMPLRMLVDAGTVAVGDTALVWARSLDPPEEAFLAETAMPLGPEGAERALEGADVVYVALDCDVLDPAAGVAVWLPEAGGPGLAELEELLRHLVRARPLAGAGLTGLIPDERNLEPLGRVCAALGL